MFKMIGSDGREYGPVPVEQLRQWLAEGRANAQTRVQKEGANEWKPIADFPELVGPPPGTPPPLAPPLATPTMAPRPAVIENYLVPSIMTTLCCCLPLGIPAIVFASQVNTKLAAGDTAGAMESSRKARRWCWLAFGLGIIVHGFSLLLFAARHRHGWQ